MIFDGSNFKSFVFWLAGLLAIGLVFPASLAFPSQDTSVGMLNLQVIVVDSPGKAQQILERLMKGEDFAGIAKSESIDPNASEGGYTGLVDPSTLRPELREALKGIRAGQITGVVIVPSGYVILKLLTETHSLSNWLVNKTKVEPKTVQGILRDSKNSHDPRSVHAGRQR